jgi:hypothetical protein
MGVGKEGPRVKGVSFRTIDACFLELRGAELHQRAHQVMSPEVRDAYKNNLILAASWYPIAWYRDVFRAFRAANNDGPDLPRMIGYQSVKRDMQSVYKQIFARIVSPQTLLSFSGKLFNQYYDTGHFDVVASRKGYVHVRVSECVGWDANMWTEIHGSCVAFLEAAGAKEVRVRVRAGGHDGDTETELEGHWL